MKYFLLEIPNKFQRMALILSSSKKGEHKQDITALNPKSTIYHIINWLSFSPLTFVFATCLRRTPPRMANCNYLSFTNGIE